MKNRRGTKTGKIRGIKERRIKEEAKKDEKIIAADREDKEK